MSKLAIIVPYRNRADHLAVFLPHMLAYFERQDRPDVSILIIEQTGDAPFNRGKLCNAGFRIVGDEADYVCFHDVDYLPIAADYAPSPRPARLILPSRLISDDHGIREDPETFFGAVVLFDKTAFEQVNGFPNCYWGWGPEDKELRMRCEMAGLGIDRRDGQFHALPHRHAGLTAHGAFTTEAERTHALFEERKVRLRELMRTDGLNDLAFKVESRFRVIINGVEMRSTWHYRVDIC